MEASRVKPLRRILVAALVALALTAGSVSAKPGWLTDFKQAQTEAKANNRLMLVDFTGSDWCGWCIKLDREVFSKPEFQEYATKNLILLEVDFPKGKQQSAEQKAHNMDLAQKHGVQGFPTIVVLNAEGKKVGELGYMPGGASAFIAELDKLRKG
jgi:protein disulfide-isomerase